MEEADSTIVLSINSDLNMLDSNVSNSMSVAGMVGISQVIVIFSLFDLLFPDVVGLVDVVEDVDDGGDEKS